MVKNLKHVTIKMIFKKMCFEIFLEILMCMLSFHINLSMSCMSVLIFYPKYRYNVSRGPRGLIKINSFKFKPTYGIIRSRNFDGH